MNILARKSQSKKGFFKKVGAMPKFNPCHQATRPFAFHGIQRKGICPCDGGCPRCLPIQDKLKINSPDDKYEQEADHMADQLMREHDYPRPAVLSSLQGKTSQRQRTSQPGRETEEEEEEKFIQRMPKNMSFEYPDPDEEINLGNGQPLPFSIRQFYEPFFRQDFSHVRIYTDTRAQDVAEYFKARAFTYKNRIMFNKSEYKPDQNEGRRLLAHELTHIIQQRSGRCDLDIQCKFKREELINKHGFLPGCYPIEGVPTATFFIPSKHGYDTDRCALIIAGIHGNEISAWKLGEMAIEELKSDPEKTDFHLIVMPHVNPNVKDRSSELVEDLNRAFGTGYVSKNPYAAHIVQVIKEFQPERFLSIHSIYNKKGPGIYLDPIHSRMSKEELIKLVVDIMVNDKETEDAYLRLFDSMAEEQLKKEGYCGEAEREKIIIELIIDRLSYPSLKEPEKAFKASSKNYMVMILTEAMIDAVKSSSFAGEAKEAKKQLKRKDKSLTPGNEPKTEKRYPASLYPTGEFHPVFCEFLYKVLDAIGDIESPFMKRLNEIGYSGLFEACLDPEKEASKYNLMYPNQEQVQKRLISAGEWLSGHNIPVITIELPIWRKADKWEAQNVAMIRPFLDAIWTFLRF